MMDHPQRFAAETSKPRSAGATLGRLWQYFRRYSWALLLVALLIIGSTYMQILIPDLTGQAVDCYLTPFTTARAAGGATAVSYTHLDVYKRQTHIRCALDKLVRRRTIRTCIFRGRRK